MHLSLRAGERVYINGAVLRVDRKVSIELLNDATFLLENHVLHADEATTPLRQLYFSVQTILIEPAEAARAREVFHGLHAGLLGAVTQAEIREGIVAAHALVEAGRLIEALKLIRGLYRTEAAIIAAPNTAAVPNTAAAPASARRPSRGSATLQDQPA
ncbi:hypothetical protein ASG40_02860 [Methylobacterium sp. Leaf399]|uniref:flagellar biosynthesis repressor FlbT n=1 Tax=unclassified Methylobacterium TaxID=2615210 RepID=UPI0006F7C4CE|nr:MULTISPECIES: flagellar biosynthesis repressor FlbT [unclassified Methylobacterium]KQP61841.1 hypothetical protein ASF39_02850 [Methylobacterium sp. Leaf108]KQT20109.1 hypothetical protein ASG40_02860 [Methylobacterium sp. Leaf399]